MLYDFIYDFSCDVLKFRISTSHFMMHFEHLMETSINFLCVLKTTIAKCRKIHQYFFEISESLVYIHVF